MIGVTSFRDNGATLFGTAVSVPAGAPPLHDLVCSSQPDPSIEQFVQPAGTAGWQPYLDSQAAAYVWDIEKDEISWEECASVVLRVAQPESIASSASFNLLIAPEHLERRRAAFSSAAGVDHGNGVPYRVQYRFLPHGPNTNTSIWLEDQGRWWAGADGRPARARGVISIVNEAYREEQKRLYGTDHDELTGHLSRTRLMEALATVIERTKQNGGTCGFLIAGINNLANLNSAFGFDVGDGVIASVGQILSEQMRVGDSIGRYSANKFGIILNDCGPDALRLAGERLVRSVRDTTIRSTACALTTSLSVGGVLIPRYASSVEATISNALQALDQAKTKPSGCFVDYMPDPVNEAARVRNITIADDVISALDNDRMRIALQPVVDSRTRQPRFYEALTRMEQPDGSLVSAGEFVEVAEQLGLARLIDRRALELAIAAMKQDRHLSLSLNVSGLTCGDPDWLATLLRLSRRDVSITSRLIVEITETAAIQDLNQSVAFIDTLKELGCKVAIDDFGAGHTSFKNLKHMAVDLVKIDGSFVKNLTEDSADRMFIETLVKLADYLGMETVAEWVVCEETAAIVAEAGVTYMQGFHLGRPIQSDMVLRKRAS